MELGKRDWCYCIRCHEPVRMAEDGTRHEGHVNEWLDQICGMWGFERRQAEEYQQRMARRDGPKGDA